jgi:hypothetical protein
MLLPVLEEAFDAVAQGEQIVRVPRLEVRITARAEEDLAQAVSEMARRQLRELLRPIAGRQEHPGPPAVAGKESGAETTRFEGLLWYLRTGSLPWHMAGAFADEAREICREHRRTLLDRLIDRDETFAFYFRLLEILPAEESVALAAELCERLPPASRAAPARLLDSLLSDVGSHFTRHTRLKLAAVFIRAFVAAGKAGKIPDSVSIAAEALTPDEWESLPPFAALPFRRSETPGAAGSPSRLSANARGTTWTSAARAREAPPAYESVETSERADSEPAEDRFPLAVSCAGLVLLHPFIARFFANTGVLETEGSGALSPNALPRAAALLYYLATGREDLHEWELGCVKVILGLTPETPLPVSDGLLTPADREEAEALLAAAVGHWSALKNTSVQGLRSSFLERNGLLGESEQGLRLRVEDRPYDVLLDQLPWNIGVVKLPWMKKAIYTEWRTL